MEDMISPKLPPYFAEFLTALFLEIGDRGVARITRKHQASWAERTMIAMTAETALVFALVTTHLLTIRPTLVARTLASELRPIEKTHGVNAPHRMKGTFQVSETLPVGTRDVFTGVLQSVPESAYEPAALTFEEVTGRGINLLFGNPDNLCAISLGANIRPGFCEETLWEIRTDVDAMGVQIRVVRLCLVIPPTKFVTPQKSVVV
jgi:hypothetical protein